MCSPNAGTRGNTDCDVVLLVHIAEAGKSRRQSRTRVSLSPTCIVPTFQVAVEGIGLGMTQKANEIWVSVWKTPLDPCVSFRRGSGAMTDRVETKNC